MKQIILVLLFFSNLAFAYKIPLTTKGFSTEYDSLLTRSWKEFIENGNDLVKQLIFNNCEVNITYDDGVTCYFYIRNYIPNSTEVNKEYNALILSKAKMAASLIYLFCFQLINKHFSDAILAEFCSNLSQNIIVFLVKSDLSVCSFHCYCYSSNLSFYVSETFYMRPSGSKDVFKATLNKNIDGALFVPSGNTRLPDGSESGIKYVRDFFGLKNESN